MLRRGAALVVMWAAVAAAGAVRADEARALPASPLLPPDHWAVAAVERLHEVGLLPEWMPAQRAAPIAAVARALAEAAERAEREAPAYAAIARGWMERFQTEWPGAVPGDPASGRLLGGSASVGYQAGDARAGATPNVDPGALLLSEPRSSAFTSVGGAGVWNEHLAAAAAVRATRSEVSLTRGEVVVAGGSWQLSVGRGAVGYGPNQLGAVVASGVAAIDRVELMTTAPLRLPSFLGSLGDFALDTAVARFSEPRHPYTPLLWEFDLQWRPHPRLTLGAVRGVMFGGALWDGLSVTDAVRGLVGLQNHEGDASKPGLENNVYSGTIQYRLPTERWLPLTAKVEWGTDDNPGAAFNDPGLVVGLAAPMLTGTTPATLGVEYAYFGPSGLGRHGAFGWYTHDGYVGGWATGETPLGDPLGGNGRALRVLGAVDPWDSRLHLSGAAWVTDRFGDPNAPTVYSRTHRYVGNLFAPQAGGRSVGGSADAALRLRRSELALRVAYDRGAEGWRRSEAMVSAAFFF